ncbi:MAG: dockerin type I domain-containing protein, partial [Candidatus Omnitrophota bacterium]
SAGNSDFTNDEGDLTKGTLVVPDMLGLGKKYSIRIENIGNALPNVPTTITFVSEVKQMNNDVSVTVTGYKKDADGNILLDEEGLPIPEGTYSPTDIVTNSVIVRADVNRDGRITTDDKLAVEAILKKALDVTGDGDIDKMDLSRITDVLDSLDMNITEPEMRRLDINDDGFIDGDDIQILEDSFSILASSDVDGDGLATQSDVDFIKHVFDFVANNAVLSKEVVEGADLNGDGLVDNYDKKLLLEVLNDVRDVDGDGKITASDAERLLEIIRAAELDVDQADIVKSDVDDDGDVDEEDVRVLASVKALFNEQGNPLDINKDNSVDLNDVKLLVDIYKDIDEGRAMSIEELGTYDITNDGIVNSLDVSEMQDILRGHVDVNLDGIVDSADEVFIDKVIEYMQIGVTPFEMQLLDLDGDGELTSYDVYRGKQLLNIYERGDVDGDGYITQYDILELDRINKFIKDVQTYLPETVKRADINRDGVVDEKDKNMLAEIVKNAVDIDGDGAINGDDVDLLYKVIEGLRYGMDNQEVFIEDEVYTDTNGNGMHDAGEPYTDTNSNGQWDGERIISTNAEDYTDSNGNGKYDDGEPYVDANDNHKRDSSTVEKLEEAIDMFSKLDINKDGLINNYDIQLLVDVITMAFVPGAVYDDEILRADLTGEFGIPDGVVDSYDLTLIASAYGSRSIRKNGDETVIGAEGRVGFTSQGDTVVSREDNTYVTYQIDTHAAEGEQHVNDAGVLVAYKLGLSARSFNFQDMPIENYSYIFEIYVDNGYVGDLTVEGNKSKYKEALMDIILTKGLHEIKFVWVNAPEDGTASVQIGDIFLRNVCDADNDGSVDNEDWSQAVSVQKRTEMLDISGELNTDGVTYKAKDNHIDIYDKNYMKKVFTDWVRDYDGKNGGTKDGVIKRSELGGDIELNAIFDKVNMSHKLNIVLDNPVADDDTLDQNDLDLMEKMVLSIYQTSRLQGADIAGSKTGSLEYVPDGIVDQFDVDAATNLLNSFVDVSGDGTINDNDRQMIRDLIDFNRYSVTAGERMKADVNRDGFVNEKDRELLKKNIRLFRTYDITGGPDGRPDGVTDEKDYQAIVDIYNMFKVDQSKLLKADIAGTKKDVLYNGEGGTIWDDIMKSFDTNLDGFIVRGEGDITDALFDPYNTDPTQISFGDGVVDNMDQDALVKALKYGQDINKDGLLNQYDIDILQSVVRSGIYIAKYDLSGYDTIGREFTYEADGVIDQSDVELLRQCIKNKIDITGDGKVDILDVNVAGLGVVIADYIRADYTGILEVKDGTVDFRDVEFVEQV